MKKVFTIALFLLVISSFQAMGQFSHRQAGVRMGVTSGIYMQNTEQAGNAESGIYGLLSFRKKGLQFTGMRLFYETSLSEISPDLFLTWGYGGHAGFVITDNLTLFGEDYYFADERFLPLVGIDVWGGLEYRFSTIPLTLGLNLKPYLELTFPSFLTFKPYDIGFSVAYTF